MPAKQPNILMFITHDSGRHFGCFGRKVATPNIDALAAGGVVFDRYFCTAPQCCPSRGSIISGKWPHSHGLIGLTHRGFAMDRYEDLLPQVLVQAGYETWLFGMQHEVHGPASILGYQNRRFDEKKGNACEIVTPFVLDWLRQPRTQPFFACIGYHETHRPFPAGDTPLSMVDPLPYLPDVPAVRQDVADLEVAVRRVDDHVGRVLEALKQAGLYDDTLVLFTTDHGVDMPRAKASLFDAGVETALIVKFPGGQFAGRRIGALGQNIDLMPTLCEVAGAKVPVGVQGRSLLPLVRGESASVHDALFLEMTYHSAYDPVRAVRTDRHKYIRSFLSRPTQFAANEGACRSKDYLEGLGWYSTPRATEQLYDLEADPLEQTNLIDRPEHAEAARDLRARLRAWMEGTADPLLKGQVRPPVGAKVTPPTARDNRESIIYTADTPIE